MKVKYFLTSVALTSATSCFSTCSGNACGAGANVGSDCIASQEDMTVIGVETPEVLGHKLDGESSADGT